jgi:hypothetical protein
MQKTIEFFEDFGAATLALQILHLSFWYSDVVENSRSLPRAINEAMMMTVVLCGLATIAIRILRSFLRR